MHATELTRNDDYDFSALTVTERIDLAQQLWDSVRDALESMPLTSDELAEIERRIEAIDRYVMVCEPIDDVLRRIGRRWTAAA